MIYVITVMPGAEVEVAQMLNLKGIKAYAPRQVVTERREGQWWKMANVLFDGYVYVDVPQLDGKTYYRILDVPRVNGFVSQTSGLSETESEYIKILCNNGDVIDISKAHIENGACHITDGFLKRLDHKIIRYNKRARRVTVEVTLYGERQQLTCSVDFV